MGGWLQVFNMWKRRAHTPYQSNFLPWVVLWAAPCAGLVSEELSQSSPGSLPGLTGVSAPSLLSSQHQHSLISQPYLKSSYHSQHPELSETECLGGLLSCSQCCLSSPFLSGSSFLSLSPFVSLPLPRAIKTEFSLGLISPSPCMPQSLACYTAKRCSLPLPATPEGMIKILVRALQHSMPGCSSLGGWTVNPSVGVSGGAVSVPALLSHSLTNALLHWLSCLLTHKLQSCSYWKHSMPISCRISCIALNLPPSLALSLCYPRFAVCSSFPLQSLATFTSSCLLPQLLLCLNLQDSACFSCLLFSALQERVICPTISQLLIFTYPWDTVFKQFLPLF